MRPAGHTRPLLDRVCDALRIPEERKHRLRSAANAMGLSEDDPSHVYLSVGEVVTMSLAVQREFMTKVPAQLSTAADRAASTVETRLEATITTAAEMTGQRVEATVVAALETFVQRERRRSWPLLVAGFGIAMLVSGALGWSLADRDHLSSSLFWSDMIATGQANDWQRIIELNSGLPRDYTICGADSARVFSQNGGLACRTAVWLQKPTESGLTPLQQLLRNPAWMLGSSAYIVVGALGCLLGGVSTALIFWWRGRR